MKTGEKCAETGVYQGTCDRGHTEELAFRAGEMFTPCSQCQRVVTWEKKLSTRLH